MSKARTLLSLQNLRKADQYQADQASLREAQQSAKQWRWVGFDATTGQGIVRSGSEEKRGKVITNGAIVPGQTVDFNEVGGFATIKSTPRSRPPKKPKPKKYVKKKKTGEKVALHYVVVSPAVVAKIGAIGVNPIVLSGASELLTKTPSGWWLQLPTYNHVGDDTAVTSEGSITSTLTMLDQPNLSLGYKQLVANTFSILPRGYGYRGVGGYFGSSISSDFIPAIQGSLFADGTASDGDANVTKSISWLDGCLGPNSNFVSLNTATMTRQQASSNTSTMIGSSSGLVAYPDGSSKSRSWSQNATFFNGSVFPANLTINNNSAFQSSRLLIASEDSSNFIILTGQGASSETQTSTLNTNSTSYDFRIVWRRNGAETELGLSTFSRTIEGAVTTSQQQNETAAYTLLLGGANRFNLVDDKLYRVDLANSNPVTGTYAVDVYQLPAMTKTTQTVTANPVPEYGTAILSAAQTFASYNPT